MRKFFAVACTTLASVILVFAIVFTALEVLMSNETYINNEFTKLSVGTSMGMSNTDLVNSTLRLVQYMKGEADDIHIQVTVNGEPKEMFEMDQEVQHMKDVRDLYLTIKQYRDTGVLVMLLLFLLGAVIYFKKAPRMLAQGYLSGMFIMLLFFGFLGTWAAMDFSAFWTFFHQTLFTNELWLFDSSESRMINMLPEQFFSDITGQIFLYAGVIVLLLAVLSIVALVVTSDKYKQKQALRESRKRAREAARRARKKQLAQAKAAAEKAKRLAEKQKRHEEIQKRRAAAAAKNGEPAHKKKRPHAETPVREDEEPYAGNAALMEGAAQAAAIPLVPEPEPESEPEPEPELTEEEKLQKIAQQAILKAGTGIHLDDPPADLLEEAPAKEPEPARELTEEEKQLQRAAAAAILRATGAAPEERITTGRQKKIPAASPAEEAQDALPIRENSSGKSGGKTGVKEKRVGRITFEFVQPDRKKSTIHKKKQPLPQEEALFTEGPEETEEAPVSVRRKKTAPKASPLSALLGQVKAPKEGGKTGAGTKPQKNRKHGNVDDDTGFFDD